MLKVIVFNAPPRTGKGVASSHMKSVVNVEDSNLIAHHMEFKDELFKVAANTVGITVEQLLRNYDKQVKDITIGSADYFKAFNYDLQCWWKDVPIYTINNKFLSTRELLIHCSERILKPAIGKDVFGKMFVNNLPEEGIVFVSDGGFPEELQPTIDHVGAENVLVVRIEREGCTFEGDSRNYLTPEMFDENSQPTFDIVENNGSIEEFQKAVEKVIGGWL
ncbi:hypothetical protein KUA24_115 [Vibrio phage HNL01]|nr:hypothetical protein KUA24_115 [Vibrio phage HNL01]